MIACGLLVYASRMSHVPRHYGPSLVVARLRQHPKLEKDVDQNEEPPQQQQRVSGSRLVYHPQGDGLRCLLRWKSRFRRWIREWPSLHVWRCRSHAPHIVRAPKARVGWAYTHFSLDRFGATSSGVCRQPTSPCSMASLAPTDEWVAGMETGGFGHRHARSTSEMPAASERPPFELLSLQFGVICLEETRAWSSSKSLRAQYDLCLRLSALYVFHPSVR